MNGRHDSLLCIVQDCEADFSFGSLLRMLEIRIYCCRKSRLESFYLDGERSSSPDTCANVPVRLCIS